MTDSTNNNPQDSLNNSDKLDAMRDKVKSSPVSPNDREDDENAIDRLLLAEELDLEESDQADGYEEYGIGDIDLSDEFDDDSKKLMLDEEQEAYDSFVDIIDDSETDSSDDEIPSEIERFFELNDSDEREFEASGFEAVRPAARSRQAETLFENYRDNNSLFADVDDARLSARNAAIPEEKPETALASMLMPNLNEFMARIRARRSEKERYDFDKDDMAESDRFNSDQESIDPHRQALNAEFENKAKNTRFFAHLATGLGSAALIAAIGFGFMAHSANKEVSRLSELVNTLEASAGQGAGKELDDIRAAIEQLNQRVDGIVKQLSSEASLSAEKETETVQERLEDLQSRMYALESKASAETAKSSVIRTEAVKPATTNEETGKPAIASTKAKRAKLQKGVAEKSNAANDWTVNLIAYRQKWHAKSKAAEFEKKGIPVDIVDVKVGNVTWYRLTVEGFKNRSEAASYAAKVKKTLKLTSVWVGNAQG